MKKQESIVIKMASINSDAMIPSQGDSQKTPTSNIDISVSNSNKVEGFSDLINDPKVVTNQC